VHLDQLPGSFFGPPNLVELLRHRACHQAQDQAFIYLPDGEDEQIDITYEELDRRARAVGAMLQSMKLQGERALLLYPAGLDFIAAFFGCLYAGVIAVPAYPPRRNRNMSRVEAIADDADARIALTVQQVLERVQVVINETPNLQRLQWLATDRLPDGIDQEWKQPDVHGDTLAFLQYTSGSTGSPKGVMLNHANLMHNSAMISYAFEHTRSGIGVFWLPSYHDMGLIGGILQPMYAGRPNVLFSPTNFLQKPFRWLKAITRFKGTVSGGPNFAYDLCVDKIAEEQKAALDLSTWSLAFNGAEPIRGATIERFVEAFGPRGFRREAFYPCYGLAEATLIVSGGFKSAPPVIRSFDAEALEKHQVAEALPEEEGTRELVGCGGNLLDQQITIVDPETRVRCPDNQVGEIWVAGPSVATGYWRRPEESEQTFLAQLKDSGEGPFLRTGDLGFILDGELFVTGRLKDLIVIRGVNFYPQDIESSVENCHADLRAGAVAAFVDDRDGQERLVVVQEVARRRDLDFEDVFRRIRNCLATEHGLAVDAIVLIKAGSIPKTSSGKIQRHACRAGYLGRTLAAVAQWKASSEARADTTSAATADLGQVPGDPHEVAEPEASPAAGVPLAADRIAEMVFDAVRAVAKDRADNLTLDTNIVGLGLDSLERVEIVSALEETFGGRFPEEVLLEMETCQQVVDAIQQYLGSEPTRPRAQTLAGEIPEEYYRLQKFPEIRRLEDSFRILDIVQVPNPFFQLHERVANDTTVINGRELINYSSFNYLGMSGDPVVTQAAKQAINTYGTSVSASRLVSGEKPIHRELERAIADFIGVDDSVVFVAGHSTNETTIGHLVGRSGAQQYRPGMPLVGRPAAFLSAQRLAGLRCIAGRITAQVSPRTDRNRRCVQHGRRLSGPAPFSRSEEPSSCAAHGRRGPFDWHNGPSRARDYRTLRCRSVQRGPVDGHAQQGAGQQRRIHCGVPRACTVSQVHRAGIRVQHGIGALLYRCGSGRAAAAGRRTGTRRPAGGERLAVSRSGPARGARYGAEQADAGHPRNPGKFRKESLDVSPVAGARHQRAAYSTSRSGRGGGAAAVFHHVQSQLRTDP